MRPHRAQPSLIEQRKALFSKDDPELSIREMKSVTTHMHKTRNLLHQSLSMMENLKLGVANTSSNINGTNLMYDQYHSKLIKSNLYIKELERKQAWNKKKIRLSFWFLVLTVVYVFFKRIFW